MGQGRHFHSRVIVWRRTGGRRRETVNWMPAAVFAAVFCGTSLLLPRLPGFDEALTLAAGVGAAPVSSVMDPLHPDMARLLSNSFFCDCNSGWSML